MNILQKIDDGTQQIKTLVFQPSVSPTAFSLTEKAKAQDSFQALDRRLYILLLLNTSPAIQVSQDRASLSVKITMPCLQGQQREPHQQQHPSLELTCAELLPARPGGSLQDWLSGKRRKRKRCCYQRKEPGSYSPGYFKVLTLKSKHVSGLWVPFHTTLPQLSWPEHMQSSEETCGDTLLASVDLTPA